MVGEKANRACARAICVLTSEVFFESCECTYIEERVVIVEEGGRRGKGVVKRERDKRRRWKSRGVFPLAGEQNE